MAGLIVNLVIYYIIFSFIYKRIKGRKGNGQTKIGKQFSAAVKKTSDAVDSAVKGLSAAAGGSASGEEQVPDNNMPVNRRKYPLKTRTGHVTPEKISGAKPHHNTREALISIMEDRENDWLARELRYEAACDNDIISEMTALKLRHMHEHASVNDTSYLDKLDGN